MPPYFASQRVILPELVGEDERRMSQANSLIEGGTAFAALIGPAVAGLLIPLIGAPNVLYVDAATYVIAFFLVLAFVPRRKPVVGAQPGGVLDGVRFLLRDSLLAPIAVIVVAVGFLASGMSAGLPVYAYDQFDGSARIAGLFYAALGAGAVVGSIVAVMAVRKVAPLRLAGLAILAFIAPMWVLPFLPPWPVVGIALFVGMFFTPLINGPFFAVLTSRTPDALRAKVMTAVISINTLAAPLGFLVAGQVLERWGVAPLFTLVAIGITLAALSFAAIALRFRELDLAPEPAPS
jgi:predicted MFS family arabinose efflux permease